MQIKINAIIAKHAMLYDSQNNIVAAPNNKAVVIHGVSDFIIVDTDQALLICKKNDEQLIKDFVADLTVNNDNFV